MFTSLLRIFRISRSFSMNIESFAKRHTLVSFQLCRLEIVMSVSSVLAALLINFDYLPNLMNFTHFIVTFDLSGYWCPYLPSRARADYVSFCIWYTVPHECGNKQTKRYLGTGYRKFNAAYWRPQWSRNGRCIAWGSSKIPAIWRHDEYSKPNGKYRSSRKNPSISSYCHVVAQKRPITLGSGTPQRRGSQREGHIGNLLLNAYFKQGYIDVFFQRRN